MRNTKLTSSVIVLLLALSSNVIIVGQAQAAACSAKDVKYWENFMTAYGDASDIGGSKEPTEMFDIATLASKKSKSLKMRAEWKTILKAMDNEIAGFPYDWTKTNSKVGKSMVRFDGMTIYKRC